MGRNDPNTGRMIAEMLATSWRDVPEPPDINAGDLTAIAPILIRSGTGALGWWGIRDSHLAKSEAARELQLAYFNQKLLADERAADLKELFSLFAPAGITPILHKGWAAARVYPKTGLRPPGDIDLIVHPGQQQQAIELVNEFKDGQANIDLAHHELNELSDRTLDDLFARSRCVYLGKVPIRVLGPEDNLRLLSLHYIRHYGYRPLWLCDVAAAVESASADFDWDLCLGRDSRQANWIKAAIMLSHKLLRADLSTTPLVRARVHLPSYLIAEILNSWAAGYRTNYELTPKIERKMFTYFYRPREIFRGLADRWPSSLKVAVDYRQPINRLPRLPFFVKRLFPRMISFALRLPQQLRR
ncbi:MAG TPA: nucleotidyltransferase family protein [Blastocatellia bacterium]|nr:nucleotidyltransferase family protein [Blastocatellia bacterium]